VTDVFSRRKRSSIMRAVRTTGTAPEKTVRKLLKDLGLAFRIHARDLPGSPDIVLDVPGVAIFVNGCFWHGHTGCKRARLPQSRRRFWVKKIACNRRRDRAAARRLRLEGYSVLIFWGCEIQAGERVRRRINATLRRLARQSR